VAKFKSPKKSQKERPKFEVNRAALPCLVLVIGAMVIIALVLYFSLKGGGA